MKDLIRILEKIEKMVGPHIGLWDEPWQILITGILSTRTKDETTDRASIRLFCRYPTLESLALADRKTVESLIKPVGFYRQKAKNLIDASKIIMEKFSGSVPSTIDELVELPGVGRKIANIVISYGLGGYGLAVDTHVFRVFNRIGAVKAKRPEEMEIKLKSLLPKERWNEVNSYLVEFGKNICRPINPGCDECLLNRECDYYRRKK